MKSVEFNQYAIDELDEILIYYNQAGSSVLDDFRNEFDQKNNLISYSPKIFPAYRKNFRKCVMKKFPYNIVFREFDEKIIIYAISHQRRKPNYWVKRNK